MIPWGRRKTDHFVFKTTAPAGNIADGRRFTSLETLSEVAVKYGLFWLLKGLFSPYSTANFLASPPCMGLIGIFALQSLGTFLND